MKINANKFEASDVLRFIRQNTNLTQKAFAESVGKSEDWQYSNEAGRSRYYFEDLLDICKKYNLEIIIQDKTKK